MNIELESCRLVPLKFHHHEKHWILDGGVQDQMLFLYYHEMHMSCIIHPILNRQSMWHLID